MLNHDIIGELALPAAVVDLRYLRPIGVAWMIARKIRHMIVGLCRLVARKDQFYDERAAMNFLAGVHIRHALHKEKARLDLQVIAFVL